MNHFQEKLLIRLRGRRPAAPKPIPRAPIHPNGDAAEIEAFKITIDLVAYAQSQGFVIDREKTCATSATLHGPAAAGWESLDHDTIVVFPPNPKDRHWTYWNRANPQDHGSIVDFVQNRRRLNLGEVRRELRAWMLKPTSPSPAPLVLRPKIIDREAVRQRYEAADLVASSAYLNSRGISPETLASAAFRSTFRVDHRGNVLFPHFDESGFCGYENRNQGIKLFAKNGKRGLWRSNLPKPVATAVKVVLCEGAIDAMSYHQLQPDPNTQYFSVAGEISKAQQRLITATFGHLANTTVVLAFDRDAGGDRLERKVRDALPGVECTRAVLPPLDGVKDWNDLLRSHLLNQRARKPER